MEGVLKGKGTTMTFLEDWQRFLGTGEKNAAGKSLEEFLRDYDARKFDCPSNTADIAVFRSEGPYRSFDQPLKLLMIRRSNHPSIGWWALPGGFVDLREDLGHAAARELEEETGIRDLPLMQLRVWGDADRDPRWRVITTSFLALVEGDLSAKAGDDAADAQWFDVDFVPLPEEKGQKEPGILTDAWRLTLKNEKSGITIGADVRRICTRRSVLTDTHYELLETREIASDHGILITDALLHLQKCCDEAVEN